MLLVSPAWQKVGKTEELVNEFGSRPGFFEFEGLWGYVWDWSNTNPPHPTEICGPWKTKDQAEKFVEGR